jgi:hypothetical protein
MKPISFADISIIACGTVSLELNHLTSQGALDARQILYTTPGLHQDIPELERQLVHQIGKARSKTDKFVVVYGGKFCYVNTDALTRLMSTIIAEQGPGIARIDATHCMDMIASEDQRNAIAAEVAGGEPLWWMTPGWVKFRKQVFKGWDKAASFVTDGCGASTVCGSLAAETALGKTPEQLADVTGETILAILGVFPEEDRHCAFLAAETLHAALDDYMRKLTNPSAGGRKGLSA